MKFCPHCGDPYTACPKCGADNDKDSKKCVSCGATLSAAAANLSSVVTEGSCKRCGYNLGNVPFCPNCGLKHE